MSEQASEKKARSMSDRRSCRMLNLRKRRSHPKVRSTTQRHRPSLSGDSTPYLAIRAAMPRRRSQRCLVVAHAECSICGSNVAIPRVRLTTQRHRPSLSDDLTPYLVMRAATLRRRSQARCAREAYARSECNLPGRLRARPESPLIAGMASKSELRKRESCI